ncbi:CRISPR-associated endonuclease Cas1 [Methanosarcina vacuolata]|uniref:CRISPR-associated protein Cas1 n=1 Tax=Methanosarcina vacuolata Z-761 TaxID=1434123 RepID=A0A0E3Q664_9EURY|nr:hypothetical protein [Methanosarcina vacuolata]AKB44190.1 CRISPR-associated protein Cas1 [Methanosarcina vacuolata Z-761]
MTLLEPFGLLVDPVVIGLVESGAMEGKDFIRTENHNPGLKPTGSRKVVNEFSNMLNKKVSYRGKESIWSYVIFLKVRELAHNLTSKKEKLDFIKPEYEIERIDSYDMRQKILNGALTGISVTLQSQY